MAYVGAVAAASAGFGVYALGSQWSGERLYADFVRGSGDRLRDVAVADERLETMSRNARKNRITTRYFLIGMTTALVALQVSNEIRKPYDAETNYARLPSLYITVLALGNIASSFSPTPIERVAVLWREEPAVASMPSLSLVPTPGGGLVTFGAEF